MRNIAFLVLSCVACSGSIASEVAGTPEGAGTASPEAFAETPADWSDSIQGDGQIGGTANGGTPGDMAGSSSSGSSGSSGAAGASSSGGSSGSSGSSGAGGSSGSSGAAGSSGASSGWSGSNNDPIAPGTLTAGVWDDNRNFDFFAQYLAKTTRRQDPGLLTFTQSEVSAAAAKFVAPPVVPKTTLDIQLIIDTTGSMGDEIAYLQREFDALASTIRAKYPRASQRWSLVLYKDVYDSYTIQWFDFRSDMTEFRTKLATATASGGGDFPEAPDQALGVAHKLSWRRDDSTARIAFWVADAPHHAENVAAMATAVRRTRDKGIHVYPVASSGIDETAEHAMRGTAQLTGGRYVFLTDDSGVGNAHKEPSVPCFYVTKLDQAILRMVDVELTGAYREPTPGEILRTGGDPKNGVCVVPGGTAQLY